MKKEKKEINLKKRLEEQGFSNDEINKIMASRKRKTTTIVVGTFAVIVVIAGLVIVKEIKANKQKDTPIENEQQKQQEEEKKLEEDIKNDKPDKDPEDIVIPDNATKEEKEKLQEEKDYWSIVKQIKSRLEDSIQSMKNGSESEDFIKNFRNIRRINNFYVDSEGALIVDADVLYGNQFMDKLYLKQMNTIFSLSNDSVTLNDSNAEGVLNFIDDTQTKSMLLTNFDESAFDTGLNDFYNNHLKNYAGLKELQDDGYELELQDVKCSLASFSEAPMKMFCISKATKGEDVKYNLMEINLSMITMEMSLDQWVEYAKTSKNDNIVVRFDKTYRSADFDWKALSEEYSGQKTQEEQAQDVIDSFSSLDENGEEVLDYPAFKQFDQQQQAEKEAKELEQKMRQEAKVTYSEQELGF